MVAKPPPWTGFATIWVASARWTRLFGVTAAASPVATLCLHSLRLLGAGDTSRTAARFGLDYDETTELLLDFASVGWTSTTEFGGIRAWSLTDAGRAENTRQLAVELDACGGRAAVTRAHAAFVPLNGRFQQAATDWQLHPLPADAMAANDHTDVRWNDRVIERLVSLGRQLRPVCAELTAVLTRFDGYPERYEAAVERVQGGQARWVDAIEVDSCHLVWMQLHEDLLATLGLPRGHET